MKNINPPKMALIVALGFYLVSGCSKSSSTNNQCNFSTGSATAPSDAHVTYLATGTGTTFLSSIVYKGASGDVTVSNPSLPWSASINFPNGGSVALSAVGTAGSGGIITLSYGISSSGSFSADTVSCGH